MVNFISAAGLLALVPLVVAAPAGTDANVEVRAAESVPFSFAKWADDIIANPDGQHPSPEEALALAFNQTSTDGLEKRQADVHCEFNKPGDSASVADAVWCIDFIAQRANVQCKAIVSATSFCRRGQAQITGVATGGNPPKDTSSPCGNVARSAGAIMDACTRNGLVYGQNKAWGNGNMVVHIRSPY
ncbi:hypothetical protein ColTof4_04574 [Colletotrichum tofieldiae]|uniref:Ecp2 effector protein domain-containing protein n=1 Tax=Colletotrichum tofieldiae TaxID=708197 RepID=A0A166W4C4_9PEZI|nr:hypothetical protein CT0861_04390 [Colletotrichum tofieldiae]GKT63848.1 hypothetical protein ColTof3_11187 [Colletotrichum tofieldiae]GKT72151.1 hypothetical protein ColTof4_04574 [Colletotrichum tofieldiae]GKT90041.1 hypothetical protein Ct61P_07891 [Colletotrichum tofieldiae]